MNANNVMRVEIVVGVEHGERRTKNILQRTTENVGFRTRQKKGVDPVIVV